MEFNAENVEKIQSNCKWKISVVSETLKQFYCDARIQQEAHSWLTCAQISTEAWTFSWQLLAQDKSIEVQFFGANCLHIKISKFWHEFPSDHVPELRQKVLDKIFEFANGPRMVLTRMCVVLSELLIQTVPGLWPNSVAEIVSNFQNLQHPQLQASQVCSILLDLLTVLPEEFFTANLSKNKRSIVRLELERGLQQVLPLIHSLMLSSTPSDILNQAIRCFSAWIQFGLPMNEVLTLIEYVFKVLGDEQLFDTAIECLVNVFSHPESYRYPACVKSLLPAILQLDDLLTKSLENDDNEMSNGICRLIITIVECESKLLLDCLIGNEPSKTNAMKLISLVLRCTAFPGQYPCDETCSEMTFGFWYILQDDIMSSDHDKFQLYKEILAPVYVELVKVLLQKVKHPTESAVQQWSLEEREQFRCYRQDIADTMMYAYNILRQPLISFVCSLITDLVERSKSQELSWQDAEAALYLLASIAESVDYEEKNYLPTIFKSLPVMPFNNNMKLISTALQLTGAYAEWLNFHPDNLSSTIPLLLQGLSNADVAQNATLALKDITRECRDHMAPYVQEILTASQAVLSGNTLKARDSIRLMSSIGHILSTCPLQDIMQYLNSLLLPHIQLLQLLTHEQTNATTKAGILLKIKMISGLFGSLNINPEDSDDEGQKQKQQGPQPVLLILQELFPLIQVLSEKWINDLGIVEAICDMFRQAVRSLMDDFLPLAAETCQMVSNMFNKQPNCAVIDLSKQLLIMFAGDAVVSNCTQSLFISLTSKMINILESGQMRDSTDVLDSMMVLLSRLVKKCPSFFIDVNCNLLGLYQTAIYGLCLPEHHTFRSSCGFLIELLNGSDKIPLVKEIIINHGQVLLDRLLQAIGGELHRGCSDHISDTMQAMNKNYNEYSRKWLSELMGQQGYPNIRLTTEDKDRFVKCVLRERGNKRKLREIVKEFTMQCRGLIGTYYGHETMGTL